MLQKRKLMGGICLFMVLLATGCGNPDGEPEISQSDSASRDMVSENASVDVDDIVSENQAEVTVSENDSQDIVEEIEVFELSNGLYAYVTTNVSRDIAIEGITEWIGIQDKEIGTFSIASDRRIMIPNVYGTITDIQMDDYSKIYICYEDEEGENGQATIPLDFYASAGNVIEPIYRWEPTRALSFNIEELTNETGYPVEVWSEDFTSGGKEYTAVYSRVSPMYGSDYVEGSCFAADYQFAIRQDDKTLYEVKLYQMSIGEEEVHYMEDVNGDGVADFIQINNGSYNSFNCTPYVFVWDPEQETCISGGMIAPEEKALYNGIFNSTFPGYRAVHYDRDNRIFYDFWDIKMHVLHHDIHDMVIVCGAKFIDGEWKTVYELYLGKEGENYARETKYDEEGNVISETIYTEEEHYDLVNKLYEEERELVLYEFMLFDYTEEKIVVNEQFSYWKYVRNEE